MDSLTPLTASLLAATVAWASILAVVHLPARRLPVRRLRVVGGLTIAALGAVVLGVPLPGWAPVALLVVGGVLSVLRSQPPAAPTGR